MFIYVAKVGPPHYRRKYLNNYWKFDTDVQGAQRINPPPFGPDLFYITTAQSNAVSQST